jgi:DNA-binding beta-propeller fold protein YncE
MFAYRKLLAAPAILIAIGCSGVIKPANDALDLAGQSALTSPQRDEAKPDGLLYVSGGAHAGEVWIFKQRGTGQQPIDEITEGLDGPLGLFVDGERNLYVDNFDDGTVAVFRSGSAAPFETLTKAGVPIAVVVSRNGTVYVANEGHNLKDGAVLEYPKGKTTPSRSIVAFGNHAYPFALALDSAENLYVGFNRRRNSVDTSGEVLEVARRSGVITNLGIRVRRVSGLTIDNRDDLLLVEQGLPRAGARIDIFPPGSKAPSRRIGGFQGLIDIAINDRNTELWLTDGFSATVYGISYPAGRVVDRISIDGFSMGVATSPT